MGETKLAPVYCDSTLCPDCGRRKVVRAAIGQRTKYVCFACLAWWVDPVLYMRRAAQPERADAT